MTAPFRSPAEMVSETGTCARCRARAPRADLVFELDGTLRCRACERPLPALAPLYRDAIPLRWKLAAGFGVAFVMWAVPWLFGLLGR